MTDKYDAKAREIAEENGYLMRDGMHDANVLEFAGIISSALRSAAAEEREACAEIADEYVQIWSRGGPRKQTAPSSIRSGAGKEIATAIRSRGDSNLVQSDDVQDEAQCDHLMEGER